MNLEKMVIYCVFYMAVSLSRLHESNIFGARAAFSMDACHLFPQSVLVIIFNRGLQMRGFVPSPGVLAGSSNSGGPPGHMVGVEVV